MNRIDVKRFIFASLQYSPGEESKTRATGELKSPLFGTFSKQSVVPVPHLGGHSVEPEAWLIERIKHIRDGVSLSVNFHPS